jgi:hypothetical protein
MAVSDGDNFQTEGSFPKHNHEWKPAQHHAARPELI